LYTYGQPRVGNPVFAAWVNTAIGPERSFRGEPPSSHRPTTSDPVRSCSHVRRVGSPPRLNFSNRCVNSDITACQPWRPNCWDTCTTVSVSHLSIVLLSRDAICAGTEYWALSPHSPQQTRICNGAGLAEDPQGSKKIPSTGINLPHFSVRRSAYSGKHCSRSILWQYFGIYMTPYLI
jgi:hypothetical protein